MSENKTRTERDSMGFVEIAEDALYGPQTQRAINNFIISSQPMPWEFLQSVILIKKVAAATNMELGLLGREQGLAIIKSCTTLLEGGLQQHFPVPVYQTGSGTSSNMNVNEVIARLAELEGVTVHANDHVNLGQSSNDVIPTAIHVSTAIAITNRLLPALNHLIGAIRSRSAEHKDVVKTGRTHLMDALPIRLQAEFEAWAMQLEECRERFADGLGRIRRLPLGGTAIGSGVNCHPDFKATAIAKLSEDTAIQFRPAPSPYKGLSSMDSAVEISAHCKTAATCLFKIANDLRWMNSGPLSGIGEIQLPALQPGSSIMPAKVNPVIPEAVCMAAAQVTGYDTAVTICAQAGNFQLNTMMPLIAANLLESVQLVTGSCQSLADKAIKGMKIDTKRCSEALEKNPILVTALNPEIGYLRAAELAKMAVKEGRTILEIARVHTELPEELLQELLNPENMADGGRK